MLQRFLPVLAMTFFISLFVVMMQFLYRYIDDLVGKGLAFTVIAELFWYAALSMVPMALPLAVLLASLMTFGNLGEKSELTAMKSAGISLLKIMKPLIIFMVLLAVGAFFFQNNVLPIAQTKMWTLMFSMRQKSPELEIPEKSFYDQIPGMNLYVESKNRDTGMLYDMIIYDVTQGMDKSRIILADSGKMSFTEDKSRLYLHLYKGEMFENLQSGSMGITSSSYLPFRRESFNDKQVYIAFDANFNRLDESGLRSQYIGKNVSELRHSIDSIQQRVDSIGAVYGKDLKESPYLGVTYYTNVYKDGQGAVRVPQQRVHPKEGAFSLDSLLAKNDPVRQRTYLTQALQKVKRERDNFEFRGITLAEQEKIMRLHNIEMQKKFTLSFAVLVFFFIGAPLGAIIKKGGLGTPLVISVCLFVVYFIFDNMGYKMARDGKVEVWQGIWLSSMVLLPLGIFFTYKALNDSTALDVDMYRRFFVRLLHIKQKRNTPVKEVVIYGVPVEKMMEGITEFETCLDERLERRRRLPAPLRPFYTLFNDRLRRRLENMISQLSYSRDRRMIPLLNTYPVNPRYRNLQAIRHTTAEIKQLIEPLLPATDASEDTIDNITNTDDITQDQINDQTQDQIHDKIQDQDGQQDKA